MQARRSKIRVSHNWAAGVLQGQKTKAQMSRGRGGKNGQVHLKQRNSNRPEGAPREYDPSLNRPSASSLNDKRQKYGADGKSVSPDGEIAIAPAGIEASDTLSGLSAVVAGAATSAEVASVTKGVSTISESSGGPVIAF